MGFRGMVSGVLRHGIRGFEGRRQWGWGFEARREGFRGMAIWDREKQYFLYFCSTLMVKEGGGPVKCIFSWGEKPCSPPYYWGIGTQHRVH